MNVFRPSIDGLSSVASHSMHAASACSPRICISKCFEWICRAVSAATFDSLKSWLSANPTVNVRSWSVCFAASDAVIVLSSPPDKNTPTGTSLSRCSRTEILSLSGTIWQTSSAGAFSRGLGISQNDSGGDGRFSNKLLESHWYDPAGNDSTSLTMVSGEGSAERQITS